MKLRTRIIRLFAIATLTPVLFLLSCQSSMIYHPRTYDASDLDRLSFLQGKRLEFETASGSQTAYFIPAQQPTPEGPIWIVFSGNAATALDWTRIAPRWDARFAYLLVDYPGYGECSGSPTPTTIAESASGAFIRLAGHLETDSDDLRHRCFVLGQSLGCAAALQTAATQRLRGAVLISPFTTMTEMARGVVGWPLCLLNRHRYDNRRHLRELVEQGGVVTIFHGDADDLIPISMSRELAAIDPKSIRFVPVAGAGHNDILGSAFRAVGEAMAEQSIVSESP